MISIIPAVLQNISAPPVFMTSAKSDFKITSLLSGAIDFLQQIGGYVVVLAGIILLIVGIVQIAKGLAGGGKGQTNWIMSIGCLVAGDARMYGFGPHMV